MQQHPFAHMNATTQRRRLMEGAPTQGFTGGQQSLFQGPTRSRAEMGGGDPTAAWSGPSAASFRGEVMPPEPASLGSLGRMGGSSYGEPAPMAPPPPRRDPSLRGVSGAGPGGMAPGAMSAMGDAYGRDGASRQGRRSKMMELLRAYGQRNSGGEGGGGGDGLTGLIAKMLMGGG